MITLNSQTEKAMNREPQQPGDALEEEKSKSQIKREYKALQKLAAELLDYSTGELAQLPLNDPLLRAIEEGRTIKAYGGRKRQIKYIGKQLSELDSEQLWEAVEQLQEKDRINNARFHQVEQWRDRLLAEQDSALAEFLEHYPDSDRQYLRQLLRNARQEQEQGKPPKAARQVFKLLREIILD